MNSHMLVSDSSMRTYRKNSISTMRVSYKLANLLSKRTLNIFFFFQAMKAYRTIPLYDTDDGPAILETEYNSALRGLIADPNIAGPTSFSDTVKQM